MKKSSLLRSTFCVATLALSLFASSVHAQTELVANGDFETGNLNGWTLTDPSNFTFTDNDVTYTHGGNWYALLGASPDPGSLLQNLNTTAGQTYVLSFYLANNT